MKTFSITEAIKFGWEKMKSNFGFFAGIFLISLVIQFVPQIFGLIKGKNPPSAIAVVSAILALVVVFVKLIMDLGFIKITLKLHDNQKAEYADLFDNYQFFWRYLGGLFLYGLIILGGFILLIIPGIIFSIRFQYYSYLIVDQGMGSIESLKRSWNITRGHTLDLFLLGLLLGLINVGGALLLFVGLLATVPTTLMAQAFVYRKLQANK